MIRLVSKGILAGRQAYRSQLYVSQLSFSSHGPVAVEADKILTFWYETRWKLALC